MTGNKKLSAAAMAAVLSLTAVPATSTAIAADDGVLISADFEDGETVFTRRGENEVLTVTDELAHGGSYSLLVSERAKSWNGPQLALDGIINAGEEYMVTAYAKTPWYATVTLSQQYTDTDGTVHYANILQQTCEGSDWVGYENIKFSFPAGSTDMYIYFEASDASVDIYIDDVTVSEAPFIQPEDIPALKDVYAEYFDIGTALMCSNLGSKSFMALAEKHMNEGITVGNELKPDYMLDKEASLAMYEADGDDTNPQVTLASVRPMLEYARDNNVPLRGHTLVWHSQTPDWFFKEGYADDGDWVSPEKMTTRMENYIKNTMAILAEEFPTVEFYAWDVVNEAWKDDGTPRDAGSNNTTSGQSAWVSVYGDNSFIELAFQFARQYAPEGCKLYYNDYNEYMSGKMNAIYDMAMSLKEKGLIDGIGMQSHLDTSFPTPATYEKALEKYASTGLDIQVTELDVTTNDTSETGLETQAQYYSDIFDALVKYSDSISKVILWGVTDDQSWRASRLPLLFDENYKAKPAYYSIIDGIDYTTTEPVETITTTTTTITTTTTTMEGILKGDVDVNGSVNVSDAVLLNRYIAEDSAVTVSEQGLLNADMGGAVGVTAEDAATLLRMLAHLEAEG